MRKMNVALVVVLVLTAGQVIAAFEELEIGIAAQAMGGTGVVLFGPGAVLWNPAAIAGTDGVTLSLRKAPIHQYGLRDLWARWSFRSE